MRPDDLLVANARFESTNWSSIAVGPPLGGAAIGLFGPVTTVVADALSYLLSALGITAIRGQEETPRRTAKSPVRAGALLDGWRHIMGHPGLRPLYLNQMLVAGLIMATEPLLAGLLLRQLGFPPWQYALAFAAPCLGGLIGSRLARRVVARFGRHRVFRTVGTLRAVWLIGLVFVHPGVVGLVTVMARRVSSPSSPTARARAAVRHVQWLRGRRARSSGGRSYGRRYVPDRCGQCSSALGPRCDA